MTMAVVESGEVESFDGVEDWAVRAAESLPADSLERPPRAAAGWRNLAGIPAKSLEWVWDRVVPRGKLTLITGESGTGKGFVVLDMVAAVTRGAGGPNFTARSSAAPSADALRGTVAEGTVAEGTSSSKGVLLLSASDCLEDTVIPRLIAAKADLSQIFTLPTDDCTEFDEDDLDNDAAEDEPWRFQLNRDIRMIEAELQRLRGDDVEVRLIVIDPLDRYMPNVFRKADYTKAVNRLTELAEKWNVAMIVVANSKPSRVGETGLRAGTVGNPILAQGARSAWMVAKDLEVENRRMLIPLKTNLCETPGAMTFTIREGAIEWDTERVVISGDEYFTQAKEKLRNPLVLEEVSEITRVTNWLREQLQYGPVPSLTIRHDCVAHDIAYSTLRRAFYRLGCVSMRTWFAGDWKWIWRMPGDPESRCCYRSTENSPIYEGEEEEDPFAEDTGVAAPVSAGDEDQTEPKIRRYRKDPFSDLTEEIT